MSTFHKNGGNIYIVDDDEAVLDSLKWLLEGSNYTVRCFDSAESFLKQVRDDYPSILLVDVRMEGISGLALQDQLLKKQSFLPLAFITGHGDVNMAVEVMKKGAFDFIQKPFDENKLLLLVERMLLKANDNFYQKEQAIKAQRLLDKLTQREKDVLEGIVAGRLNKQIAGDLNISMKTVEIHRSKLMQKLQTTTVANIVKMVLVNKKKIL
jgi:FixJ family two-component response regulator